MEALVIGEAGSCEITQLADPSDPVGRNVLIKMQALTLNHLDVYAARGMSFAQRKSRIVPIAEGVGRVVAVGPDADAALIGKRVAIYPAPICGSCNLCTSGREFLCAEGKKNIYGFNVDGLAREYVEVAEHLLVEIPSDLRWEHAACAPVTYSTVVRMLYDNARLNLGETILVHSAGSGIGSAAILLSRRLNTRVIATVGSEEKVNRAAAIGAHHVVNYSETSFSREVRRLTNKEGVDVVFEHVGPATWEESLHSLKPGGRLVTCGSTSGISAATNLLQLFNKQISIFGSFGAGRTHIAHSLNLMMYGGLTPVIDSIIPMKDFALGLEKLQRRDVFGKIVLQVGGANG